MSQMSRTGAPGLKRRAVLFGLIALAAGNTRLRVDAAAQPLTVIHQAPRKPGPGKPPLLVLLHGYGADEKDLLPMVVRLDPQLAIASPRAPVRIREGSYSWLNGNSEADLDEARRTVLECIDQTVTAANADAGRVYVAGFSQGAMLALAIALTEPQKIAGAAVLSGRLAAAIRNRHAPLDLLRGFPILVTHGTEDRQIPIRSARDIRQTLKPLSIDLEYHEFEIGHSISDQTVSVLDRWLRQRLARK
jgi:phospholipase/carboxylesterase